MAERGLTLSRRIRRIGGRLIRRLGLLPGGMPDALGDDERLLGTALPGEVLVYFPDTSASIYQLRGWYGPLRELHRDRGVTIVCMDSRTARLIRSETDTPVVTIGYEATLDEVVARSGIKLILYVNYNPLNEGALRLRSVIHVSLLHGDSDKGVSVSNQVKAYDYSFVAGQAAIDRFEKYTALFDARTRCIPVGRPALDTDVAADAPIASTPASSRPVVLYAPTWEGGHATVSYSSLPTHGTAIIESLVDAGFDVVYRPHPLTGVRRHALGEVDGQVRAVVEARGQRVSTEAPLVEDFARADLLICDVSAVVTEWLATGKPLIVTEPDGELSQDAATRLLSVVPRLSAADAARAGDIAADQLENDPARAARREVTEYYLGDTRPGASLARFLEACHELADLRDREWARIRRNESGADRVEE